LGTQTLFPGSVNVPGEGWLLFGGEGNSLTRAQVLKSVDAKWELGPNLFELHNDFGHCLVQVFSVFDFNNLVLV